MYAHWDAAAEGRTYIRHRAANILEEDESLVCGVRRAAITRPYAAQRVLTHRHLRSSWTSRQTRASSCDTCAITPSSSTRAGESPIRNASYRAPAHHTNMRVSPLFLVDCDLLASVFFLRPTRTKYAQRQRLRHPPSRTPRGPGSRRVCARVREGRARARSVSPSGRPHGGVGVQDDRGRAAAPARAPHGAPRDPPGRGVRPVRHGESHASPVCASWLDSKRWILIGIWNANGILCLAGTPRSRAPLPTESSPASRRPYPTSAFDAVRPARRARDSRPQRPRPEPHAALDGTAGASSSPFPPLPPRRRRRRVPTFILSSPPLT